MNMPPVKIDLREQKDKIFIILVVIFTIFIGRKILDGQKVKLYSAQGKIQNYQQRAELVAEINKINKEIERFQNVGWQTQESVSIMGKINELASQYDIEILTFDPGNLQDSQNYLTLVMTLNVNADYFSLTKFLSAIEDLEALTKVISLQMMPLAESGSGEHGPVVRVNLIIASYIIKK